MMDEQPTLFLVDDDPAILDSLVRLGGSLGLRTEAYHDPVVFLKEFEDPAAGCCVVDVRMPTLSGLDLLKELRAKGEAIPVIVISGHGDIKMSVEAMKLGAVTFLEKPFSSQSLVDEIREAIADDRKRRKEREKSIWFGRKLQKLTDDELRVLIYLTRGRTNQDIAKALDLSPRTVQFRRSALFEKMDVQSKSELLELLADVNWQAPTDF